MDTGSGQGGSAVSHPLLTSFSFSFFRQERQQFVPSQKSPEPSQRPASRLSQGSRFHSFIPQGSPCTARVGVQVRLGEPGSPSRPCWRDGSPHPELHALNACHCPTPQQVLSPSLCLVVPTSSLHRPLQAHRGPPCPLGTFTKGDFPLSLRWSLELEPMTAQRSLSFPTCNMNLYHRRWACGGERRISVELWSQPSSSLSRAGP